MFGNNQKNISLEIFLDDDFKGIMYGLPEESLGCKLRGKVVLNNRKSFPAKHLLFIFLGKITVACGPPMSSSRPEYSEIKPIFRKECLFHNSATSNKRIPAGTHEYYFDIDIPGHLPSSFKGARGKIEYYCTAILARPIFRNDLAVRKTVHIKRCLIDEARATQVHHTTFTEGLLDDKIRYQISTPIMTFREGGLVQNELTIKSTDSDVVVEAIEYGLKEQVHYQTTGEEAMAVIANVNEERYPLGKRRIKVDPNIHGEPITITFRLCPWVNCDVDSQLINVNHKLSFTICVSETINIDNESVFGEEINRRSSRRFSARSVLSSPNNNNNNNNRHLRRSSRTFSLTNIVNAQRTTLVTKVEKKRLQFEIPIIVTAKSCMPRQQSPPYAFVDRPPAYAIASMVPPPPEYSDTRTVELSSNENLSNDYVAYDLL